MGEARTDLIASLAEHIGAPPLTAAEMESILALAAVAAHGTGDRTTAPMATFLAGIAAASAPDRNAVLDDIRRTAATLAPTPDAA